MEVTTALCQRHISTTSLMQPSAALASHAQHGTMLARASHLHQHNASSTARPMAGGGVLRWRSDSRRWRLPVNGVVAGLQPMRSTASLRGSKLEGGNSLLSVLGGERRSLRKRGQRLERAAGVACSCMAGPAAQGAASLFTFATVLVMPFYTMMLFAPEWPTTKKLMNSSAPYLILGILYMYLLTLSWTPQTLPTMFSSKYLLPELSGIARMFTSTLTVASAWMHILAMDLFAARHIYLDGLERQVATRHSLILCLMFGPIGIFCHLVTTTFVEWRRKSKGSPDEPDKLKRMAAMA